MKGPVEPWRLNMIRQQARDNLALAKRDMIRAQARLEAAEAYLASLTDELVDS